MATEARSGVKLSHWDQHAPADAEERLQRGRGDLVVSAVSLTRMANGADAVWRLEPRIGVTSSVYL